MHWVLWAFLCGLVGCTVYVEKEGAPVGANVGTPDGGARDNLSAPSVRKGDTGVEVYEADVFEEETEADAAVEMGESDVSTPSPPMDASQDAAEVMDAAGLSEATAPTDVNEVDRLNPCGCDAGRFCAWDGVYLCRTFDLCNGCFDGICERSSSPYWRCARR